MKEDQGPYLDDVHKDTIVFLKFLGAFCKSDPCLNRVLISHVESFRAEGYGSGVTAGKKEAINYDNNEALAYAKHIAYAEGYQDAKARLLIAKSQRMMHGRKSK